MHTTVQMKKLANKFALGFLLLTLTLCLTLSSAFATDAATAAPAAEAAATAAPVATSFPLGFEEAKAIALERAQQVETDVFFTTLQKDYDDGRRELEVEFVAGDMVYSYEIDADNGQIVRESTQTLRSGYNLDPTQYIGWERALEIALADAGMTLEQVVVSEMQFDFDDGRAEYDIQFNVGEQEYQYEMSALTGDIYQREVEREGNFW